MKKNVIHPRGLRCRNKGRGVSIILIISVVMAATILFSCSSRPNRLTRAEKKGGWTLLFNGNDFKGWRQYNGPAVPRSWIIEEDALKLTVAYGFSPGQMSDNDIIYYKEQYRDFELSIDWKISRGGNSGIFYNIQEVPGKPVYYSSAEVQVLDNKDAIDNKVPSHLAGSLYDIIAADTSSVRPAGEWNNTVIRIHDGHAVHFQNGLKVAEYELWSASWDTLVSGSTFRSSPGLSKDIPREGYIGLQDHGYTVWYRNIKIREL